MAFAVIPMGPVVSVFGHRTPLQLTDLPVAVLYILAVTSIGVYGIVLAGWASGSTYPLLGGLRSSAQVISYEIAMALSFAAVFLYAGTMSTSGIVAAQNGTWYVFLLLPSFLVYLTSMVGETNRAPFDLPEAEGELVGGFHTEYSSLKFAMFMLAEYVNMTTVSALATTMFLGGWHAPWPISMWDGANTGWWPLLWFTAKVWAFLFFYIWLRATLPRLRYDQFMALGWKVLIPVSLVWIAIVATTRSLRTQGYTAWATGLIVAGTVVACFCVAVLLWRTRAGQEPIRTIPRAGGRCAAPSRCRRCRAEHTDKPRRKPMPKFLDAIAGFGGHVRRRCSRSRSPRSIRRSPARSRKRYHGRHQLNRYPDGLEKCIGCELCAWACPADAIYVEGADNTERGTLLARRALRPGVPDQLSAVHRLRAVHRGLPDPRADHDQRVRDGRRQPRRPDLRARTSCSPRCSPAWWRRRTRCSRAAPTRTTTSATSRPSTAAEPSSPDAMTRDRREADRGRTSTAEAVLFWVLGAVAVIGAIGVVAAPKAVYSAIFLAIDDDLAGGALHRPGARCSSASCRWSSTPAR